MRNHFLLLFFLFCATTTTTTGTAAAAAAVDFNHLPCFLCCDCGCVCCRFCCCCCCWRVDILLFWRSSRRRRCRWQQKLKVAAASAPASSVEKRRKMRPLRSRCLRGDLTWHDNCSFACVCCGWFNLRTGVCVCVCVCDTIDGCSSATLHCLPFPRNSTAHTTEQSDDRDCPYESTLML